MKFGELKVGDTVYTIVVKNSEIIGSEVNTRQVNEVCLYKDTDSAEIHFTDKTMIMPGQNEEYVISGLASLSNILNPFNFTIYATSYDLCVQAVKRIVSTKITQLGEDYKKINIQMARLCLMSSVSRDLESKAAVVLEPVYAD